MGVARQNSVGLESEFISDLVERLVTALCPQKIVLFGSRARGDHRPDSDVDILIIKNSELPRYKRAVAAHAALSGLPVPADMELLVYTPQEVKEWSTAPAAFVTTALREGKVLYEE